MIAIRAQRIIDGAGLLGILDDRFDEVLEVELRVVARGVLHGDLLLSKCAVDDLRINVFETAEDVQTGTGCRARDVVANAQMSFLMNFIFFLYILLK